MCIETQGNKYQTLIDIPSGFAQKLGLAGHFNIPHYPQQKVSPVYYCSFASFLYLKQSQWWKIGIKYICLTTVGIRRQTTSNINVKFQLYIKYK